MSSKFGAASTTDDVLAGQDLSGMRIVVTGVSAGLGIETARALVAHGARVIGTARDLKKAEGAIAPVRDAAANGGSIELIELDLASLASVRACADGLVARGGKLDVIIANAGVMACPFGHTSDGFELQFGTNHLGHFVFINRIEKLLGDGGRVVVLSSSAHRGANVDLNDPNFERTGYNSFVAYSQSKTANALFAFEFDRRYRNRGIRATAVHPGGIDTELGRHMAPDAIAAITSAVTATNASLGLPPSPSRPCPRVRRHRYGRRSPRPPTKWVGVIARIARLPDCSTTMPPWTVRAAISTIARAAGSCGN